MPAADSKVQLDESVAKWKQLLEDNPTTLAHKYVGNFNQKSGLFADIQEEQLGEVVPGIDKEYKEAIHEEEDSPAPYIPIIEEYDKDNNGEEDPPEPEDPHYPPEDFDMRS
eukprot:jgi/Psemu1/10309/gm1.10309_g